MKIRVCKENQERIERTLKAVNGKATAHTITSYYNIEWITRAAKQKIQTALGSIKAGKGVVLHFVSGERVANSYRYCRKATHVVLQFNVKLEAFLVSVSPATIYKDGGRAWIEYTDEQKERIKELALTKAKRF